MPILKSSAYVAPLLLRNGHAQTIYATVRSRPRKPNYHRERFETLDHDFIDIDWSKVGSERLAVLFHGLEGCSQSWYMQDLCSELNSEGFDVAAFNFRSCSGEPNRHLHSYHSGQTRDLHELLPTLKDAGNYQALFLGGFSLGGNVLLKYLGELGQSAAGYVDAAIAISVPCDLAESSALLERPANSIYMRRFVHYLRKKMDWKSKQFPDALDFSQVPRLRTFRDIDGFYTAPVHGFESADAYWEACSSRRFLENICVPTLLLNAADDPFLGPRCSPRELAAAHPCLLLEQPAHGGHNGFVELKGPHASWSFVRACSFFKTYQELVAGES